VLCAHALCFVLCAPCSCFKLFGVFGHRSPSTKHAHGADGEQQQADAPAYKNRVFLSGTAKHKAQSMSPKQPILTKRCDFEHKARSTKHKALSMSTKQRQKNWAQVFRGRAPTDLTVLKKLPHSQPSWPRRAVTSISLGACADKISPTRDCFFVTRYEDNGRFYDLVFL
jgi:hypothetical protein